MRLQSKVLNSKINTFLTLFMRNRWEPTGTDGNRTEPLKKAATIGIAYVPTATAFAIGSPKGDRTPDSSVSIEPSICNGSSDSM